MTTERPTSFAAGTETLSGTLAMPAGDGGRSPAVLLVPSFLVRDRAGDLDRHRYPDWFADSTPPARLLARLAGVLAGAGVVSLRWDKRGAGASDGDPLDHDLFVLADDARDALAHLRQLPEVDPTRIGLIGHGEGGLVVMSVAAADPAVGPLALIGAPGRDVRTTLRWGASQRHGIGPPLVRALDRASEELIERVERGEATMGLLVGEERLEIPLPGWRLLFQTPGRALASLQDRPVLVMHGAADRWVDPAEAELLAAALPGRPTPHRISGAGHDLVEAPAETLEWLARKLAAHLVPRPLPTHLLSIDAPPSSR